MRKIALLTALTATTAASSALALDPINTFWFTNAVTAGKIHDHLERLDAIANRNGDTRALGTPGYAAVVGAHLDSVVEGPGINDNGSGAATLLTIAEQMTYQHIRPRNHCALRLLAFILNDIRAGGLFSGAEGIKTPPQAAAYGGTAGAPYDPCYHQACDDIDNLSLRSLGQLGKAAAHTVLYFAMTREDIRPDAAASARLATAAASAEYRGPHLVR
jgi:Zn-dependent M28 family amino/carboxypeptidase